MPPPIPTPKTGKPKAQGDKRKMQYEFTGRHIEITPAVERLVREELGKLDRILNSAPMRSHIIVSAEKHRKRTEIVLHWRDTVFTAVSENAELRQSVAEAAAKIQKQVLRLKERFQARTRGRQPAKAIAPVPGGDIQPAAGAPRIIAQSRYRVKPMTPEEAAIILADSEDQFIVFRDAETNKVGVLYSRTDGNFGLIEP
jgi:putative sigma-54 modulation protein